MRTSTRDIGTPQRDPGQQDLHRVFISYSRSDFYFAEQLAGALRRRGLAVWFDVHELGPGTDWSSAIDLAISECDTFLIVASRAAMESPYVQQERDRAVELTRSCIAVLPRRPRSADVPSGPTYDLAGSFSRGVDQIATDLTAGSPRGWRPRIPLPFPSSVLLVALAPVLATLLAVVMGTSFAQAVGGQLIAFIPNGTWAVAVGVSMIALVGVYSAYCSWAFIMRRSSWLNVRGFQFTMPLIALLAVVTVDTMAGYINEPWIFALGGEAEETYLGDASAVLAVGVVLASAVAAILTSYTAGPCRHLKTGVAPERVRRRHIGPVPGSLETRPPAHSYRLIAAEDDSPIADEVRRVLDGAGMAEVSDDGWSDRQIVVTSDRTPTEWLSRDELREPLAVVATSIDLPVRGVLQRFQWVDYRRRRSRTLAALARDLTAEGPEPGAGPVPPLPESLQRVRLPTWLVVVEWTIFSMATLAVLVAAYPLVQWALTDLDADLWPALLGLPIAGALVMLARLVRGRLITPGGLVAVVAVCWLGMFACGLDGVAGAMFDPTGTGPAISPSLGYSLVSAIVFGLSWRSLRRWLPRHLRWKEAGQPTLGSVSGSWPWRVALVPLVFGFLSATGLNTPTDTAVPGIETLMDAPDVCADRAEMLAFLTAFDPVNEALQVADAAVVRSALAQRIQLIPAVLDDLGRFEPTGTWGTDMKRRLIAGIEGVDRADRAYLDQVQGNSDAYDEMNRVVEDLNAPFC